VFRILKFSFRYEWIEIALLHKSLFASKWMQALYSTLGHTFPADNAFSLLYVMYNPVCRKDIIRKNRLFNELLAAALHPLHKEYLGHARSLFFYIKSGWIMLKFAIKNRAIADCNPTLVLAASEQPHAALLKDINRVLMLVNSEERDAKTNWNTAKTKVLSKMKSAKMFLGHSIGVSSSVASPPDGHLDDTSYSPPLAHASGSCFEQMKNCWKRHNRIIPTNRDNEMRYDDAPKSFVDSFALKREFVVCNITEEARVSLLTMLIFTEDDDFGLSLDCRLFRREFDAKLISFRKAFRVLFFLLKQLEFADSSENIKRFNRKERIFQRVSDMIFGKELKLLRNFHLLSDKETAHLFLRHDFPELDVDDCFVPSVDAVLQQLLADDKEQSACASSKKGIHSHDESFPNTLNLASSILASNQMQPALSAHDHDVQSQSNADIASHAPQAFALTRPSAMFSKKSLIAVSPEAPIASAVHESIEDDDVCLGSRKLSELTETGLKPSVTKDNELCAIKDELKNATANNAALLAQVKELQTALRAASQKNKFPHSQIDEAASTGAGASSSEVKLTSLLAADTEHHLGSADSASTVTTRCRPKIYSSKNLRVTARTCINEVTSPAFGCNAEQLGIDTFDSDVRRKEEFQSGALIHVPTATEADMLALMSENSALRNELKDAKIASDAEIKTLQTALHAALEAQRSLQTQSKKGLKSAGIQSSEENYEATLQRAAAAEAQVQTLSSKVKLMQDALDAASQDAGRLGPEQISAVDALQVELKSANASAAVVEQQTAVSDPPVNAVTAAPLASLEAQKGFHAPSQQAFLKNGSAGIKKNEDESATASTSSAGLHSQDSAFQVAGRLKRTAASVAKLMGQVKELRNEGRAVNQANMYSPDQGFLIESSELRRLDGLAPFKKVCLHIIHKNMHASTHAASSVKCFVCFLLSAHSISIVPF
jgi:hypothetical protein